MSPWHTHPLPVRPKTLWGRMRTRLQTFWTPPHKQYVYAHYNRLRQDYILQHLTHHYHKRMDDPAPLYGLNVLDVGCGTSNIGSFLALSGASMTAVDANEDALKQAKKDAHALGTPLTFIHGDVEQLVERGHTYDVLMALDVLEDVPEERREKFLWALRQLVKPEGILILSSINRTWKAWFVHIFLSRYVLGRSHGAQRKYSLFYTPQQLRKHLYVHNLALNTVQGLVFDPTIKGWRLTKRPDTRYLATVTPF